MCLFAANPLILSIRRPLTYFAHPMSPAEPHVSCFRLLFDPFLIGSFLVTTVIGPLVMKSYTGEFHGREFFAALILSLTHGILALFIAAHSVGPDSTRFFLWSLCFNALRVAALLGLFVWIERSGVWDFPAFLSVALVGYFAFLAGEVLSLHVRPPGTPDA